MTLTLLLPWFPIILGVGVGGNLLGRKRGFGLGILAAVFWVVLVQAACTIAVWNDPWIVGSIVAGAIAIVAMGAWAGCDNGALASGVRKSDSDARGLPADGHELANVSTAIELFDDWLDEHRDDIDPWPAFDEFVRNVLHRCCGAMHVRPFRLVSNSDELVPLREMDPLRKSDRLDARRGIVGHVVTTGHSYLAGDGAQGELIERLAAESDQPPAWCFAITQGVRRKGVVTVGLLQVSQERIRPLLHMVECMVGQFWNMLDETRMSRSAVQDDPVTGFLTRAAFLRIAEQSLRRSYDLGEPVAIAVVAIEGLRELNDSGRWDCSDELVRSISQALRCKLRVDDCLGRFDESRVILLLRRVDSELASMIMNQLVTKLRTICREDKGSGGSTVVRCGLTGSGTGRPDLRTLMSSALRQYRHARVEESVIANDLETTNADSRETVPVAADGPE